MTREQVLGKDPRFLVPNLCILFTAGCGSIDYASVLAEAKNLKFFCSLYVVTTDTDPKRTTFYEHLSSKDYTIIAHPSRLARSVKKIRKSLCPSEVRSKSKWLFFDYNDS